MAEGEKIGGPVLVGGDNQASGWNRVKFIEPSLGELIWQTFLGKSVFDITI